MNLDTFFVHAVRLEHESVATYGRLASLAGGMPPDVTAFLEEMAYFARLHLDEILGHAGRRGVDDLPASGYQWGKRPGPETLVVRWASGKIPDLGRVMRLAHDAERRAARFYASVATAAEDDRVARLASHCAREEHQHMLTLERFMGLKPY